MRELMPENAAGEFREWLTAADLLALHLPGLPRSRMSTFRFITALCAEIPAHLQREVTGTSTGSRGVRKGSGRAIHYTALPPEAMVVYEARHRPRIEAAEDVRDTRLARKGSGILPRAEGGRLRAFIVKMMVAEPKITAARMMVLAVATFGPDVTILSQGVPTQTPMPPLRTFQHFMRQLREEATRDKH